MEYSLSCYLLFHQYFMILIIIIIIIPFLPRNYAQLSFMYKRCGDTTYAPNSTYQLNLKQVLNHISSDDNTGSTITYGFYNFTAGHDRDRVEATALCRGDLPFDTCRVCVRDSATTLPLVCPNKKEAFAFNENCVIFFSDGSEYQYPLGINLRNADDVSTFVPGINNKNRVGLNVTLYALMSSLQKQAAKGDSRLKYATGSVHIIGNHSFYGMVQCNPDLSGLECLDCVQKQLNDFPTYITAPDFIAAGERSMSPSCNNRYELYQFYGNVSSHVDVAQPPQSNSTTPSTQVGKSKSSHKTIVLATVISGSIALVIIASICILLRRRKQRKSSPLFTKEEIDTLHSMQYSFWAIKVATDDFSNKLGQGGFGVVYKGKLLDGQEIAVKRLTRNSGQGNAQFKNEILTLSKLQHRNLVRLLGFCLEDEEIILIYEFVSNGSLDNIIFDPVHRESMVWETRFRIINGIAKGLHYLHQDSRLPIIHRDLKAGNVLLDADFNPKIADFGMARLFNLDQTQAVASKIVGTYGYMPPEYLLHGNVSIKMDVYSFGVLVLEIVSGQRISSFQIGEDPGNLLAFAWKNWLEGTAWNLVDPTLSIGFRIEILRCINIGLLCVQKNQVERPTMLSVTLMLSNYSLSLQSPSQPAFLTRSQKPSNDQHQSNTTLDECSINEVTVTEPYSR